MKLKEVRDAFGGVITAARVAQENANCATANALAIVRKIDHAEQNDERLAKELQEFVGEISAIYHKIDDAQSVLWRANKDLLRIERIVDLCCDLYTARNSAKN
jgi:peptidoglycan hydrolase CwlO-like protein